MNKQIILFLSLVILVACGGVESGTLSDANEEDGVDRITPPTMPDSTPPEPTPPDPTPPEPTPPDPTPPVNSFTYNECAVPGLTGVSIKLGTLTPIEISSGEAIEVDNLLMPTTYTFYPISIIDRRALAYKLLAPQEISFLLLKADLCTTTGFESPMPIGPYYLVVVNLSSYSAIVKITLALGNVEPAVANVYNDLLKLQDNPVELKASAMLF